MQFKHTLFVTCLVGACALAATPASAQDHRVSDTPYGYAVEFEDSDLLGQTLDLAGLLLPLRSGSPRILLIRPRASFVPELSGSIEAL
jgi:hypothetical protein